jgi:hypothetical protein
MARSDFGLSSFLEDTPQLDLGGVLPSPISPLQAKRPSIVVNAPRAQTAMQTKYSTYMRELSGQYDQTLIQSMMDFDAQRVKNGQSPLGQEETIKALEAARTKTQQTPEPEKSAGPLAWAGNAISDIRDIVTSIPRLPVALIHEAEQLSNIGDSVSQASNPIAGLFQAPGVRMLPGAFIAGNLAEGNVKELFRHPVYTALDVLPLAAAAAKVTPVVRAATGIADDAFRLADAGDLSTKQFRTIERQVERPISAAILNRLGPDGSPVQASGLPFLTPAGELAEAFKGSKLGRMLAPKFGAQARDMVFGLNTLTAEFNAVKAGDKAPRNMLEQLAVSNEKMLQELRDINPALLEPGVPAKMYDAAINGNMDALTPDEMAGMEVYKSKLRDLTEWSLANNMNLEFGGEIYDMETGAKLVEADGAIKDIKNMRTIREAVESGNHGPAVDILLERLNSPRRQSSFGQRRTADERAKAIRAGERSDKEVLLAWRGTRQSLRNAGYDTSVLDQMVSKKGADIRSATFRKAVEDVKAGKFVLPKMDVMDIGQILEFAKANMKTGSVGYRDLLMGIQRGEWKGVTAALDTIKTDNGAFNRGVRNLRDTARLMDNKGLKDATLTGILNAENGLAKLKRENQAARFLPKQQELVRQYVAGELVEYQKTIPFEDAWSAERIMAARDAGELADVPGFTPELYRQGRREAALTLETMKQQGFNPIFVHTVPVNRVESSFRFSENIIPKDAASTKKRLNDLTPGIRDLTVALNDMDMQFLQRPLVEAKIMHIEQNFGYTIAEINAITHEEAAYRAGRSTAFDYEGHKQKVITERYRQLNPEDMGANWGSPYINKLKQDAVYVPKNIYDTLKDMAKTDSLLGGVLDPATKLFRISTTALSIRTQIYNVVGGAVALTLTDPLALAKYSQEAIRMLRDPRLVPDELRATIGSTKRGLHELDDIAKGKVVGFVYKYMVGKKLRTMWDQAQAAKQPGRSLTGRFGDKVKGLVEKSYELNSVVDDFYRTVAYLGEYDRQIGLGRATEVASHKAVAASRKILQDYMSMTPFERNVIKSILPFYGFIGYAIRFVLRFPFDHPLRAEFMTKLAMAELEDNNMGLPARFMSMLFFGDMDDKGNQSALNLGPFNPFGDVANSMTLAGFLGNTNPVLQTAFQMVGLDQGTSELYPSLVYDPQTGRMKAQHPGALESLIGNVIPPAAGVLALMGMNSEFNDMRTRDPEAAGRYLLSAMTIPTLERQYNVPQEQFAAEMARGKSQTSVLNRALKSGDWSEAMLYPDLRSYLAALEQLTAEQLAPFQPTTREDQYAAAQAAFAGQAAPQPSQASVTLDELVQAQIAMGGSVPGMATTMPQPVSGLASGGALGLNGI